MYSTDIFFIHTKSVSCNRLTVSTLTAYTSLSCFKNFFFLPFSLYLTFSFFFYSFPSHSRNKQMKKKKMQFYQLFRCSTIPITIIEHDAAIKIECKCQRQILFDQICDATQTNCCSFITLSCSYFFFLLVVVCVQDGNLCYINRIIEFEALQNEIQEENNFVCVFNANFCSTKRKWKDSTLCKRERGTNYLAIKFSSLNNAQHSFLSL